jgi:hypothetical protein
VSFGRIHITDIHEGNEVEMDMIWNTESLNTIADTSTVSSLLYGWSEDIFCDDHHLCVEEIIHLEDITYFFFWDEKCMAEMKRMYVEKSEKLIIFIDLVTWYFSSNNTRKNRSHKTII